MSPVSAQVRRRLRNRVIEYFETVASYDEQMKYQEAVPHVSIPRELICPWEDLIPGASLYEDYVPPEVTIEEQAAMVAFNAVWENTTDFVRPLEELIGTPEWERLRQAGETALAVFAARGKLPED